MLNLPHHQVKQLIYNGPNSLIYRGIRSEDELPMIFKVLKEDYPSPEQLIRYQQEYDIIQSLETIPGVINAYHLEKYQNKLVICLEDVAGQSLKEWLTETQFDLSEQLNLAIAITEILGQIHQHQVIHKDINPANIVWNRTSNQLKIIDFGISTRLPKQHLGLQNPEKLEGTLAYISPEQTGRMNRSLDYRTDLYSLGVAFYELFTGQLPFEADSAIELVHNHIAQSPLALYEVNSTIPPVLSALVEKLMAKNVEDRYQSALGVKWDLEQCLNQLTKTGGIHSFPLGQRDFSTKLHIPQKLYGREHEISMLFQTFERISEGKGEFILIAGYSGVGKTALVHEMHKPMTEKQGYFATGKFDQYQHNTPYSALAQAFGEFCQYILTESEEALAQWKMRILSAIGNNGQLLIDIIPQLEIIIGSQPPIPQIGGIEAQNRFNLVFQNFFQAICKKKHPLILFIDDLQWADSASLNLLKTLITDTESHSFLIIGAYRENEVDETHPLMLTITEFKKTGITPNTLTLQNLSSTDINNLICDTLKTDSASTLAQLVYQKTQGNAFFTHQFLHTLYENNLLRFNVEQRQWQWDIEHITAQNMTDNVIELMASKIAKLPADTVHVLQLAACMGNQFDLSLLSVIYQHTQENTLTALWKAIVEGLIQPLDTQQPTATTESHFKFSHDRIQQAAYAMIEAHQKEALHLQIGRLLLKHASTDIPFEIVDHLNQGSVLISDAQELTELAQLNLAASQKAKAATAYKTALNYCLQGQTCLSEKHWDSHYKLTYSLSTQALETAYLSGDFKLMAQSADTLLAHIHTPADEAIVRETQIQAYTAQNERHKAIQTAFTFLQRLNIYLPEEPTQTDVDAAIQHMQHQLSGIDIQSLADRPVMSETNKILAMQIMVAVTPAAYQAVPKLMTLLVLKQVELSLQYGNVAESSFSYVCYGLILCGVVGDINTGYHFGKLALRLLDCFTPNRLKASVIEIFNAFINVWKKHIRDLLHPLLMNYQTGLETGELGFAAYSIHVHTYDAYFAGKPLKDLESDIVRNNRAIERIKQAGPLNWMHLWWQVVLNLRGQSQLPYQLTGSKYDETVKLPLHQQANDRLALHLLYLNKCILHYLFYNHTLAVENAEIAASYLNSVTSTLPVAIFHFYEALARLAIYPALSPEEQADTLAKVAANQTKMQHWAVHAPMNFQHKYYLVEAECARVLEQYGDAREFYDQAIQLAQENDYLNEEALANELAAKFYLARHMEKQAQPYLRDAHHAYRRWGATAKVKQLEELYPHWLVSSTLSHAEVSQHTTFMTSLSMNQHDTNLLLDLDSIVKALQALSSEIHLDKLLEKLMHTVIENAGAQRGLLILEKQGQWVIEAEGSLHRANVDILHSLPLIGYAPTSVINYVTRTQTTMVLYNAHQEGVCKEDAYVQQHKLKSILCTPIIAQQKLLGAIYLENNLAENVFTPKRIEILSLLSTQIAISLENARFVEDLEVARRQAEIANKVKTTFLANMSHEFRTPLNGILGYVQLFTHTNIDISDNTFQQGMHVIQRNGEYLLTLINDLIDISTDSSGETGTSLVDIRLDNLLNNLIDIFRFRSQEKGLNFVYQLSPDLPLGIVLDEKRLKQILNHLLSNAVKFTTQGEIKFMVMRHQEMLRFQLKDTGRGIAAEDLEKIFHPFEQVNDWQHKSAGAGLGLSLAHKLVKALGGKLHVKSRLNQGSCFQVDVPLIESKVWQTSQNVESSPMPPKGMSEPNAMLLQQISKAVQLLSTEQVEKLYELSMNGDVQELIKQADELAELNPQFMPLVNRIRQMTDIFDTDPIADLLVSRKVDV